MPHRPGRPTSNFSCAGDRVIVYLSASALYEMLAICQRSADEHHIIYSLTKSVSMNITRQESLIRLPSTCTTRSCRTHTPSLSLVISYQRILRMKRPYGRKRETCALGGNTLIRTFRYANEDVKREEERKHKNHSYAYQPLIAQHQTHVIS